MSFYPKRSSSGKSAELFPSHSKAPEDHLVAYIDGGARGNPGPAGYGVVIKDFSGNTVAGLSEYLGHQTNNYAEYSGLLAALKYAVEHGPKALKVISDSELMVKQIRGLYKVKNLALQELHGRAQGLIGKLEWFSIQHVLREKNREADALANAAMDKGMGRTSRLQSNLPTSTAPASARTSESGEFEGVVRNGVIALLDGDLAEGTRVQVRVKKVR